MKNLFLSATKTIWYIFLLILPLVVAFVILNISMNILTALIGTLLIFAELPWAIKLIENF